MIPAVLLVGGLGTRLRSVVADQPKALAPVAGEPFLAHLLRHLQAAGVDDVVLATGYLSEQIEAFAETQAPTGLRVRCVREDEPLGTGGALAHAVRATGTEGAFLALNGDTFFGGDLHRLVTVHEETGAAVTMALAHVEATDRYGRVLLADDAASGGRVAGFVEKQAGAGPGWINAGVYAIAAGVLDDVEPGAFVSLERDRFPGLVAAGAVQGVGFPGAAFLDIGTPEDFARAPAVLSAL